VDKSAPKVDKVFVDASNITLTPVSGYDDTYYIQSDDYEIPFKFNLTDLIKAGITNVAGINKIAIEKEYTTNWNMT